MTAPVCINNTYLQPNYFREVEYIELMRPGWWYLAIKGIDV